MEAHRLGHAEAEVLLVHETVPRSGAGPRDVEPRDVLRLEPPHLRRQRERRRVPKMYRDGLFTEIIDYVTRERDAAMDLLKESRGVIGDLGDRRRRPLHKDE